MGHKMRFLSEVSALPAEPEYFKANPLCFQVSFCTPNVKGYFFLSSYEICYSLGMARTMLSCMSSTIVFNSTIFFLHDSISTFPIISVILQRNHHRKFEISIEKYKYSSPSKITAKIET